MHTLVRSVLATISAAVLVGCASNAPAPSGNPLQNQLVADVTAKGALPHLEALQRIADDNGGNRASPGPGYDASVDYVTKILRDAGYQVSTPTFRVDGAQVRNVIAQTRTGNPERVVMAGAHLDSVEEGPGINDNGSGVASLLEIAVRLGGSPDVSNAVRFAFWGAEETGLIGSEHYVEELSEDDRDRIVLYLNLDMVGSPNPGYRVERGDGRRSATVADVLVNQLAVAGVSTEAVESDGGSDHAPFIDAGITSVAVMTGDDEEKTAEQAQRWGGQAGQVFDPCYHKACDRLDNIDTTALDRFTDAVAGTIAHFAISTDGLAR